MWQSDWRKVLGNAFIAVGLLVLLGVGGVYGWEELQAKMLQDQLQALPPGTEVVLASGTQEVKSEGSPSAPLTIAASSPAPVEPSPAPSATPAATLRPAPAGPASKQATETATATATPTQPPPPTPVPGTKPVGIQIPDLKIDVPVTDMTWKVVDTPNGPTSEWEIPKDAVGHAVNSVLLGEPGNLVLSGHNNIYGRVFMRISQAWPETGNEKIDVYTERSKILTGRKVILTGEDGRQVQYVITDFYRVKDSGVPLGQRIKNGEFLDPTEDTRLTITTCWPPWSNTHRLIVIARPAG